MAKKAKDDSQMLLSLPGESDPGNYRKNSVPFETFAAADAALVKFWQLVQAARNECKIADVYMVLGFSAIDKDSDSEAAMMGVMHLGDSMRAEALAAYGFGKEQTERQKRVAKLMSGDAVSVNAFLKGAQN